MAHNINKMAFTGETPWHGLGTKLERNATFQEVYDAAGYYEVQEVPLWARHGDAVFPVPSKALVRMDKQGSDAYLHTAGADYTVCQFRDLARVVVEACGATESVIHTAGTLGETGARGWILAELPERFRIAIPGDTDGVLAPYVLACTSHDGTLATHVRNCLTRVVCQNTLGAALGEKGGASWTIRHTKNAPLKLADAGRALAAMGARVVKFGELGAQMARLRLSDAKFESMVRAAIAIPEDGKPHPQLEAAREEMRALRTTFKGATPAIIGTAWGDFQALTEALDHGRRASEDVAKRAESSALGDAALAKSRGLEVLLAGSGLSLAEVRKVA